MDDTKDESQTVQTGKTEDKKDEVKTEEKSDETKTEDAKTETKTDDKTSTDSKTEDKTNETKPVTSSTNTTTAKPSAPASTSKPSASTSKPAASAPASKPAQSKPAASAPAETKPAEPAKPTASQASGYVGSSASALESALGAPTSKSYSPSAWAKVRTASGRMTGLPFIPIKRAVRRLSKRFNKLAVSNRRYSFMFRRGGQWPPFFAFCRGKIKGQTGGLPYGR